MPLPAFQNTRQRRLSIIAIGLVGLSVLAAYLPGGVVNLADAEFLGSNLVFFLLININLIALLVLGFLVGRNVIKLFVDRRANILGSRLRVRLVSAFVALSLIPSALLFLVAKGILSSVLQGWFLPQVSTSVDGALSVASQHYEQSSAQLSRNLQSLGRDLKPILQDAPAETLSDSTSTLHEKLQQLFQQRVYDYGLVQLVMLDRKNAVVIETRAQFDVRSEKHSVESNSEAELPPLKTGERVTGGSDAGQNKTSTTTRPIATRSGEYLQASVTVPLGGEKDLTLVGTEQISPEFVSTLAKVLDAYDNYRELGIYRRPLASGYVLALSAVTLLIVFSAIWIGFYLARELTVPIQRLAEGTDAVAHGNLDYQIMDVRDDELGVLVDSFNRMTRDLKQTTSELVSAQRMAAWREVARRIAHEIKNPLTPIQLSAQRLKRKLYTEKADDSELQDAERTMVRDCADTITTQVETLRTLVNEFSNFATMPQAQLTQTDLNALIFETTRMYREGHRHVEFDLDLDPQLPLLDLDREQMGRVLVNLLDNAVASVDLARAAHSEAQNRVANSTVADAIHPGMGAIIQVASAFNRRVGLALITVTDNGVGIPEVDKPKVFEPYYTTKRGGTGLGLAIVSSIISDHNGFIRVRDHEPQGVSFVIELPVRKKR